MNEPVSASSDEAALPPLTGVAALADRPVDGRLVARVFGVVALVLGVGSGLFVEHLLAGANVEPDAARSLRARAVSPPEPTSSPGRVAVLYVDGMRADEAEALTHWNTPGAAHGRLRLPLPTLSRPFQQLAFTGVPHAVSGVHTNRFTGRSRFDSVMDRVREADGSVILAADGLDWLHRMHGRDEDDGSTRRDSLDDIQSTWLPMLESSPPPGLLVLHAIRTDGTAHHGDAAGHAAALAQADRLLGELLEADLTVVCLSDHGHIDGGGHGGPEPIVARAPILIRDLAARVPHDFGDVSATRLASTLSTLLGVSRPRHAMGPSIGGVAEESLAANVDAAQVGGERDVRALWGRRRIGGLFWFVALFVLLGPVKRAYGFDRSTPLALFLFPCLVLAMHLALGRPLSLSAIDSRTSHVLRVAALGLGSALSTGLLAIWIARGPWRQRLWRSAASVAWSATASASLSFVSSGFALGPWPLSASTMYLPLLLGGAASVALAAMSAVLLLSSRMRPRAARAA